MQDSNDSHLWAAISRPRSGGAVTETAPSTDLTALDRWLAQSAKDDPWNGVRSVPLLNQFPSQESYRMAAQTDGDVKATRASEIHEGPTNAA